VIVLSAVVTAAWLYFLTLHGGYWRTSVRLPGQAAPPTGEWPAVVAVVPARDEADILPTTLPTLLAQDYPGPFTVVLADDDSADGTADVAKGLDDVRVVTVGGRPDGWAGKVHAMARGLEGAPGSEYVLFADADIAFAPGTLTALIGAARAGDFAMVSQMALLNTTTFWERVVVPAFVYFFAQLYPFRLVNRPRSRTAAAAGGCMLVSREALCRAGGLAAIRDALIDDVSLGRLLKRSGGRCWLGLTTDVVSRRPYPGLASLWNMIARSAYTQLRYSPPLLLGTIIGLLLLYALPPVAAIAGLAAGSWTVGTLGLAAWAIMTATFVPMLRFYGLSARRAPALPLIALMYAAMTVDSARRHWLGRGGTWKGRTAP
jgi:hopene-associated glycosyltransferase HpnB